MLGWLAVCACLSFTVIHKIYSYHYHSRSFSRFPFRQSNSSKNSNLWENGKLIKFSINFIFYGNLRSYRYTLDALVAPHIFSHDDYACARASEYGVYVIVNVCLWAAVIHTSNDGVCVFFGNFCKVAMHVWQECEWKVHAVEFEGGERKKATHSSPDFHLQYTRAMCLIQCF